MPWRPSKDTWQRRSLSGFLTLLILLSSSFCWQRVGRGPQLLQIGIIKGQEQGIPTALCPTWSLVSRTPCHHWWGVPHPVLCRWDNLRKGAAVLPGCPPHGQEGDPPKAHPTKDGVGNSLQSSADRGGADSDGYSMVSKAQSTCHCRRR